MSDKITVKELITKLGKYNPELEVVVNSEAGVYAPELMTMYASEENGEYDLFDEDEADPETKEVLLLG